MKHVSSFQKIMPILACYADFKPVSHRVGTSQEITP
jgi:hypothetical protein